YYYLEMENCSGGNLGSYIARNGGIGEENTKKVARGLLDALTTLNEMNFCHGDIRLENIVLKRQHKADRKRDIFAEVRLIDLDEATKVYSEEVYQNKYSDMWYYFSPEKFNPTLTGEEMKKADVWALAIVLLELLHGKHYFEKCSEALFRQAISNFSPVFPNASGGF
ncbi:CAMK family protein kinase, partial [Reticulomyxa filosa]